MKSKTFAPLITSYIELEKIHLCKQNIKFLVTNLTRKESHTIFSNVSKYYKIHSFLK